MLNERRGPSPKSHHTYLNANFGGNHHEVLPRAVATEISSQHAYNKPRSQHAAVNMCKSP